MPDLTSPSMVLSGLVGPVTTPAVAPSVRDRPAPDGLVDTADLPRILWHRRFWIIGLMALFMAAALIYSVLTPWLYAASAQILIDPRGKVVVSNDVNPTTMAPDGGVAQVESQARVIESTSVLLRAIKATDLSQDPEFVGAPGLFSRWIGRFDAQPSPADQDGGIDAASRRALIGLRKRLAVKRADKVFVIDITITARSPEKAARIANAIAQAYLDDQAAARTGTAVQASDALVARLAEQKKQVNAAENAVERYKAENDIVAAANGILVSDQQLTDITAQLEAARTKTAEARARLDQIEMARRAGGHDDATMEALGSTVMSQLRAREASLVEQEAQLKMQFGPRHPAIAAIASQRRDVQLLVTTELDRILRSARADAERATANESSLLKRLAVLTRDNLAAKQASVRLRELERDLEASRTVYASFLLRAQETREQASIDSSNARVITQAIPPQDRSWPLIGFLVLGALGGGFGLGASVAFAGAYLSPTILSATQLQRVLGVPVISVALPARRRRLRSGWRRSPPGSGAPPAIMDDVAVDLVMRRVIELGPTARGSDSIFSVLLACGEGSETRCADLAQHLATAAEQIGDRVLLVDATAGDGGQTLGLLDVMRGDTGLDMATRKRPNSRMMTLAKGTHQAGSSDWPSPRGALKLFAQAAQRFDVMVVNGGVTSNNMRLSRIATRASEVLMVAEYGKTQQSALIAAVESLAALGCSVSAAFFVEDKGGA